MYMIYLNNSFRTSIALLPVIKIISLLAIKFFRLNYLVWNALAPNLLQDHSFQKVKLQHRFLLSVSIEKTALICSTRISSFKISVNVSSMVQALPFIAIGNLLCFTVRSDCESVRPPSPLVTNLINLGNQNNLFQSPFFPFWNNRCDYASVYS